VGVVVWAVLSVTGAVHAARPAIALLPLVALPLVVVPVRLATGPSEGRALLPVLAATGRLQLVFGVLLSVALWLWIPGFHVPGVS
jgi:1,4-dihydroxy-2-naphthoate octaprenyltransferase